MPNEKNVIALDVEMKTQLWMPNGTSSSERQTEKVALNAKWKAIALDVETRTRLWTPNGKSGSERQTEKVALNAK